MPRRFWLSMGRAYSRPLPDGSCGHLHQAHRLRSPDVLRAAIVEERDNGESSKPPHAVYGGASLPDMSDYYVSSIVLERVGKWPGSCGWWGAVWNKLMVSGSFGPVVYAGLRSAACKSKQSGP